MKSAFLLVTLAALAGCGLANNPTQCLPYNGPTLAPPLLIYPQNGSQVPASATTMYLEGLNQSLAGVVSLSLKTAQGTTFGAGVPGVSSGSDLPVGAATPHPSAVLYSATLPALASGTTYTVIFHYTGSGSGCTAFPAGSSPIGTFSTL